MSKRTPPSTQSTLRFWWKAGAAGVIGPRHTAAGQPTQDACAAVTRSGGSLAVAVVADGHGSAKYVRSDRGARFAVEVVRDILLRSGSRVGQPVAELRDIASASLPAQIVEAWRARVDADLAADPGDGIDVVAYGTTVIGAAATTTFIVVVQLGDGGSLVVYADGAVESVFPGEEQIGTATHSLCSPNATKRLQVRVFDLQERPIDFVFLATDGFETSYTTRAGFEKAGADIVAIARQAGRFEVIKDYLPQWLTQATTFTGDDATAAYIIRGWGKTQPTSSTQS